ncbi:MAG: hypothetical protein ABIM50_07440 [Novosphingobium sp.]
MSRSAVRAVAAAIASLAIGFAGQPALASFTVPPNRPAAYAPRDTCVKTPAARAFVARLRNAVAQHNARALADLAAPDIRLDFGGGGGKALLRSQLASAEGPALWRELSEAVGLGCAMSNGDMAFPWLFAQNLGDADPFDAYVVTGPAVPLYRRANAGSGPIARLNWQLVIARGEGLAPDIDKRSMRHISVINSSLEGYVASNRLRSVIGHRLIVSRHGPTWEITAFVAGD